MRDVPTRTPMPMVEMSCNRDWESENDSGRDPARKDLYVISAKLMVLREEEGVGTQLP